MLWMGEVAPDADEVGDLEGEPRTHEGDGGVGGDGNRRRALGHAVLVLFVLSWTSRLPWAEIVEEPPGSSRLMLPLASRA